MPLPRIERRVTTNDGCRLYAMAEGAAYAPVVMLAASLAATAVIWRDQVTALCGADLRVICFDTRGHGESDAPAGPYSLERLGRDALAVMDAFNVKQAAFCGLSLGGLIGQWLALEVPERLTHLCIANSAPAFPPASIWHERADKALRGDFAELVPPTVERWLTAEFRHAHPERTEAIRRMIAATPAAGYAGCCAVLGEADLWQRLAKIRCPTLVIGAHHDRSTTAATAQRMAATIPNAKVSLLDAAHLSNVEASDAFNDALLAHIAAIPVHRFGDQHD